MPVTRSASKSNRTTSSNTAKESAPQQTQSKKKSAQKNEASKSSQSKLVAVPNTSKKRTPPNNEDKADAPKKKVRLSKETPPGKVDSVNDEESIQINRSPVLQLWASVVAAFLHPDETWDTCLSVGSSISTLCAISKGKAIGQIEPKEKSAEEQRKKKQRSKEAKKDSYELEVMGFSLHIKSGAVVLDGKAKPAKESLLRGKFGGEEEYEKVKQVMKDALQSWTDDKDVLNSKAFHMYEQFRPNTGWGRKGELKLHEVKETIKK